MDRAGQGVRLRSAGGRLYGPAVPGRAAALPSRKANRHEAQDGASARLLRQGATQEVGCCFRWSGRGRREEGSRGGSERADECERGKGCQSCFRKSLPCWLSLPDMRRKTQTRSSARAATRISRTAVPSRSPSDCSSYIDSWAHPLSLVWQCSSLPFQSTISWGNRAFASHGDVLWLATRDCRRRRSSRARSGRSS